jgi:hypothetical protein
MIKFLLAITLLAASVYWGCKHFTPAVPTMQEKVSAVLIQGGCSAEELAKLSDFDSTTVEKNLKGRMLTISGVLSKALTKGVGSSDLILELKGTPSRKINFTSDFQQFTRMIEGIEPGDFKFQKFGHELVIVSRNSRKTKPEDVVASGGKALEAFEPTVVFREGDRVSLKGLFQHVGKHSISLQLREIPIVRN